MTEYACMLCICVRGVKARNDADFFPTTAQAIAHVEEAHSVPVSFPGESPEKTAERFRARYGREPKTPEQVLREGKRNEEAIAQAVRAMAGRTIMPVNRNRGLVDFT